MLPLIPFASMGPADLSMSIDPLSVRALTPLVAPRAEIDPFIVRASTLTPSGSHTRREATTLVGRRLKRLNMSSQEWFDPKWSMFSLHLPPLDQSAQT